MNWTKALPTNPGYYWWRKNKYKSEHVYCVWIDTSESVGKDDNVLYARWSGEQLSDKRRVTDIGGEWFGPIKPPGDSPCK